MSPAAGLRSTKRTLDPALARSQALWPQEVLPLTRRSRLVIDDPIRQNAASPQKNRASESMLFHKCRSNHLRRALAAGEGKGEWWEIEQGEELAEQ